MGYIGAYMTATAAYSAAERDPWRQRRGLARFISFFARRGRPVFNCEVEVEGLEHLPQGGYLAVANHQSYFDIVVLSSIRPFCYVTSVEIRETPFLGRICKLAGCIFVERRNKRNLRNEINELTAALMNDIPVCVFPEATSTNGEQLLRFRRPLFHAAVDSQRPVVPVCINYLEIDQQPVTTQNRDSICWYDDMPFAPHLLGLLSHRQIKVRVTFLAPIATDGMQDSDLAVPDLVEKSFQAVASVYKPIRTQH
jgi:1-acyl-sn-glycerol-3-phosphate acyltransferase